MSNNVFNKIVKVIDSCNTQDQVLTAIQYLILAFDHYYIEEKEYMLLDDMAFEKLRKLCKHTHEECVKNLNDKFGN